MESDNVNINGYYYSYHGPLCVLSYLYMSSNRIKTYKSHMLTPKLHANIILRIM